MRDRYLRRREISRGAFGRVHLALDQATGRNVAIKELIQFGGDAKARFVREAHILYGQRDNRYVVALLDHDLNHSPPYIVLEYCEHGSLRTWVRERRPWRQVATALGNAVRGLEGIHCAGGFHRDIKPENLLVATAPDGSLIIKVADFGLARAPSTATGTMTHTAAGTRGYIAPEILAGDPFASAADIYSLGIVAVELLTGGPDPRGLKKAQIPNELQELVRLMVSGNAEKRPVVGAIAQRLDGILAPSVPRTQRNSPVGPSSSSSNSGLAPLVLGGLTLLGLAKLATGLGSEWDADVQRYRGPDGRFRKR